MYCKEKKVKVFYYDFGYMRNDYVFLLVTFLFTMKYETPYSSNIDEVCLGMPNKCLFNSFEVVT